MASYPCDNGDGNEAVATVSSHQDGDTQFLCGPCLATFGIELARLVYPELLPQPEPAPAPVPTPRGRGKKAVVPEVDFDEHRTIATIVESAAVEDPVTGDDSDDDEYATAIRESDDRIEQDLANLDTNGVVSGNSHPQPDGSPVAVSENPTS